MKKLFKRDEKGFTIIEVVLVLAIAGLIFLVVFLALPQLQSSRRDTQRKGDAGRIVAAMESYASNHNGIYPATIDDDWLLNNVDENLMSPDGNPYSVTAWAADFPTDAVYYGLAEVCNSDGTDGTSSGEARRFAIVMGLESGQYCQDNQ